MMPLPTNDAAVINDQRVMPDLAQRDLIDLLSKASVEISSRGHEIAALRDGFSPGCDVTITFLPGDEYHHNIATAAAVRRAGFNPVPHISARETPSRELLADFLARLRGEAAVERVLLVAGDVARAKGPFGSTLELCESGLIEQHGITVVTIAGHPEGHPHLETDATFASLVARRDWGRKAGVTIDVVTQFCFESAPILDWLVAARAHGLDVPVSVGLAGPATPATLMKFALRCGIGNSMRALRGQIGRFGRLMTDTGPDAVVDGIRAAPPRAVSAVTGFHLFPLGGLRKTSAWLRSVTR